MSDVGLNGAGLIVAMLAVLATAGQQVLIGWLQKVHSITANELMGQTAPIQVRSTGRPLFGAGSSRVPTQTWNHTRTHAEGDCNGLSLNPRERIRWRENSVSGSAERLAAADSVATLGPPTHPAKTRRVVCPEVSRPQRRRCRC